MGFGRVESGHPVRRHCRRHWYLGSHWTGWPWRDAKPRNAAIKRRHARTKRMRTFPPRQGPARRRAQQTHSPSRSCCSQVGRKGAEEAATSRGDDPLSPSWIIRARGLLLFCSGNFSIALVCKRHTGLSAAWRCHVFNHSLSAGLLVFHRAYQAANE